MERPARNLIIIIIILAAALLLQATLLERVAIKGVKPDIVLIILVFVSLRKGPMAGQLSGFISGIIEDLLSLAPLGFHAFSRTLIGFLYGLFEGNIYLDPVFMPLIVVAMATIIKAILSSLVVLVFSISTIGYGSWGVRLFIEVGYNALLSPFLFALLGLIRALKPRDKDKM